MYKTSFFVKNKNNCSLANEFSVILFSVQICVLQSLNNGPMNSEYVVSGTTYAPEGFIFDSLGAQVFLVILVLVDRFPVLRLF